MEKSEKENQITVATSAFVKMQAGQFGKDVKFAAYEIKESSRVSLTDQTKKTRVVILYFGTQPAPDGKSILVSADIPPVYVRGSHSLPLTSEYSTDLRGLCDISDVQAHKETAEDGSESTTYVVVAKDKNALSVLALQAKKYATAE